MNAKYRFGIVSLCSALLAGCSGADSSAPVDVAPESAQQAASTRNGRGGESSSGSCSVPADETTIQAMVEVLQPSFVRSGHERVRARLVKIEKVFDASIVSTPDVDLAMRLDSSGGSDGLPRPIALFPGARFEVSGIYIPKEKAYGTNHERAVIHYTHPPCGSVTINGSTY